MESLRWMALGMLVFCFGDAVRADDLYETLKNRTCIIVDPDDGGRGTGFIVDLERRLVVTNYHVAQAGTSYRVFWELTSDGETWTHDDYLGNFDSIYDRGKASLGVVVAQDSEKDLAILRIDQLPDWLEEMPLASDVPERGDVVHYVGQPGGRLPFRYSIGEINYVGSDSWTYENVGQHVSADILRFRTQAYGGFSGSGVVNDEGELIGVLSGASATHATAIQVGEVRDLLDTVKTVHAFAIHNERNVQVRFQIRIGDDEWESYEVESGYSRWWWTADLDAVPQIKFDCSFDAGYQEQRYDLDTKVAIVGKGVAPQWYWQQRYKFAEMDNGVNLYAK